MGKAKWSQELHRQESDALKAELDHLDETCVHLQEDLAAAMAANESTARRLARIDKAYRIIMRAAYAGLKTSEGEDDG